MKEVVVPARPLSLTGRLVQPYDVRRMGRFLSADPVILCCGARAQLVHCNNRFIPPPCFFFFEDAERVAADMISESRMSGRIDQMDGLLYFTEKEELEVWDAQIHTVCSEVNLILSRVSSQYEQPEFKV